MLKKHKNQLMEEILAQKISPTLFVAKAGKKESFMEMPPFRIKLRGTPLFFNIFVTSGGKFSFDWIEFTPLPPGTREMAAASDSFENALKKFGSWLANHVRPYMEYQTDESGPDLWAQLKASSLPSIASGTLDESEVPLTNKEKDNIRIGIENFRAQFKEQFAPSAEQWSQINYRLDYICSKLDRIENRFDLRGQLMATLSSIAVNMGVDTNTGRALVQLFTQSLQLAFLQLPHP